MNKEPVTSFTSTKLHPCQLIFYRKSFFSKSISIIDNSSFIVASACATLLLQADKYNFIFGSVPEGRMIIFALSESLNSNTFAFGTPVPSLV